MEETVLTLYCKQADFDASTGQCVAPFYGPAPMLIPPMSAQDGFEISVVIAGAWAIGYMIRQSRRVTGG